MSKREKKGFIEEAKLDMTPIIDCVFLLLIFFMVTTVFKNPAQLKMTLPDAYNPKKLEKKIITVEITADGIIAINGKQVTIDQFDAYLMAEKQKTSNKSVVIRTDKETKHSQVLKIMKLAKAAQIEQISLATEDLSEKEKSAVTQNK